MPCNGCTKSYKCMKAQQKKLSGCESNLLAHEDLGHFEEAHRVGFYSRVRRLQIKISYAQNNQEHATGDGSRFVTTRRVVPCSGRRVGAARPRGSSPPRSISLEQPVVRSHVRVRRSGASAPNLTVSRVGGTSCGGLLGPITQPAASGGVYSQHMQTLVTAPKRSAA